MDARTRAGGDTALDERQDDAGESALKAIERVAQMLREEVIPKLPNENEEEKAPEGHELEGAVSGEEEEALAVPLSGRGTLPCRKGGPNRADKAIVAKIGPKLRGKLHGHLTADRICCARRIVAAVKARHLHRRAAVIAVTTTIVELSLLNVNYGYCYSLGLFQQRASWGTRAQRLNPTWATNAFLNAMLKKFPKNSWMKTPIGKVCQRVQVSAFPSRYQPEAADARIIVGALWGAGKAVAEEEPGVMAAAAPDGANQGALEALRRVAELLTEDVIPMLSGGHGGEEPFDDDGAGSLSLEGTEPPEDGQDEPPADREAPAAVTDAFEEAGPGRSSGTGQGLGGPVHGCRRREGRGQRQRDRTPG